MGVTTSEVGYTPATPTREDYEVRKGHVVALEEKNNDCKEGILEVPFITAFPILLLFCCRSIFETVLFLLSFPFTV